ncbi:MAG: response regulator transcription factor [Herpetosiphonaceae bacterium]|nr:response regulator transcription factor [Herpetosiphonaceae bacterium]
MLAPVRHLDTAARVLLLIDQPVLAEYVNLALQHATYLTRVAETREGALEAIQSWRPQLAVIDMDITNGELLAQLGTTTARADRIPVIALTRRGDLQTKLAAFDAGVDDILTVPFSPEELVARLLAIMRRTYGRAVAFTPVLRIGELEIDILHRRVVAGGSELHLTSVEQSLLYVLAANAGRLLTRDDILDHLWGVDYVAESNVVDRHIRNLRVKLQDSHRRPRYIATVPGRGYRFVPTDPQDMPSV